MAPAGVLQLQGEGPRRAAGGRCHQWRQPERRRDAARQPALERRCEGRCRRRLRAAKRGVDGASELGG